jgi:hypothetical protein
MPMVEFTLESLRDLDGGKAAVAFTQHVKRAALDCLDRPGDKAARKVTLEISLIPVMEPGGDCTEVDVQIKASSAVPKHQTKPYSFGLRRGGMLVFNPDATDNVNQSTYLSDPED